GRLGPCTGFLVQLGTAFVPAVRGGGADVRAVRGARRASRPVVCAGADRADRAAARMVPMVDAEVRHAGHLHGPLIRAIGATMWTPAGGGRVPVAHYDPGERNACSAASVSRGDSSATK